MSTVASVIFDFDAQPKEPEIVACLLCGSEQLQRISERDRYGFSQACDSCRDCGLAFLNPRMTKEAYARFYETAYRPLVSAFHGREINAQTIQPEQVVYGRALGRLLAPYRADCRWRLLDIGGSTGVVAQYVAAAMEMKATVMDPSPIELAEANKRGCLVLSGTIESYMDVGTIGPFDLITLCQTSDHLLDLMGSLKKIKSLLSRDGLFWSDIVNFDKTKEVKIDHPFNLTESTYRRFLSTAGFELLQINYAPDGVHIGFLCK